jgi:chromosome segregation protein
MLRIEKVFLQGFKSFCDPTEVAFDEEGITAVVGPNGCGKSNISDAVNWVIGEQRARALRGAKMEDVIFQGSRNRQPAGLAEVLLTMVVHETFEIRSDNGKESVEPSPEGAGDGSKAAAEEAAEPLGSEAAIKPKARRRIRAEAASRVFQEGERVTVGRRLYRTGESEYEMNGRACRLRDIQDLFAGTGLGGAHYAIIEQGRIGQVLSAKPLDRRALIEEAAGISKFKMRQHAAELKLDASRQNLSRVTDIIAEIERQQNSLKRQAARARRYQRLRSEMRELMRAVYVADFRATRAALSDLESEWGATVERETAAQERIAELEAAQTQAAIEAGSAEQSLNETRTAAAGIDLEAARARQQHQYLSERLSTLGARADEFARDRETITGRSGFIEQESARLRAELQSIEGEINSVGAALASDENEHRKKLQSDAEAEQNLESARRKLYDATTTLERWRQLKRQFDEAVDRSETRRQGLAAERARAQSQAEANEQERLAIEAERAQHEGRAAEIASESSEVQMRLGAAREERAERRQVLNTAHRDLTAVEHRLKSLEELDARRAYFSEAVQLLLSRAGMQSEHPEHLQEPGFRVLGTLADFVTVAPEHEATVETSLHDELQYVLVPGFDDAFGAIEFLKAEHAGRATFMVVGLHGAEGPAPIVSGEWGDAEEGDFPSGEIPSGENQYPEPPSLRPETVNEPVTLQPDDNQLYETQSGAVPTFTPGTTVLIDMLGLRPEFASVFARALPRLAAARVVDTAADAVEAAVSKDADESTVFVTRAGERVVAGRLVTGGTSAERSGGVLALKREIVELTQRFGVLSGGVHTAEIELGEIDIRIQALDAHRGTLDAEIRDIEKELAVLRTRWQQCERDRERIATHLRVIGQETAQIETDLAEYQGKLAHAASQTEEAERSHAAAEAAVAAAQAEVAELRRASDERSQELSRRRAEFAARTERRRGLQNDLQRLENEARDLGERLQRTRLATVEAEEQMRSVQAQLSDTAARLADLTAQQEQMNEDLNRKSAELHRARERLAELDLFVRAAREAQAQAREDRARLELDRVRLTSSLEHLAESCHHELGEQLSAMVERLESASSTTPESSLSAAQERAFAESSDGEEDADAIGETDLTFWYVPENFDLAAAKARLDELRAKIDALGPINMMALDELNEIEERYHFLIAQKADIEQAIADTQAAIAEIKRRSRERFSDAFHSINRNFQETFQELFGGGRGEMRLIDENDILESGIEIIAQPPGKRLQNVLLLSGGEKAMAAIALVLAIFKYRPSPFCILDEVDAPLDEVNIARFADKVLEMSRQTQFVIITHSKRTMEAARTLYGVTMEDPGVSKLISVRLT